MLFEGRRHRTRWQRPPCEHAQGVAGLCRWKVWRDEHPLVWISFSYHDIDIAFLVGHDFFSSVHGPGCTVSTSRLYLQCGAHCRTDHASIESSTGCHRWQLTAAEAIYMTTYLSPPWSINIVLSTEHAVQYCYLLRSRKLKRRFN
jgi:hypothetical protein